LKQSRVGELREAEDVISYNNIVTTDVLLVSTTKDEENGMTYRRSTCSRS